MDLANATISNTTRPLQADWNYVAVIAFITAILAFFTNTVVILVTLKQIPRNTFYIYVTGLLSANLVYTILGSSLDVVNDLYPVWFLGWSYCTVYLYGVWVLPTVQAFMHLVITVNRGCAAAFPIKYRHYHNQRVAVLLTLGAWIFGHVLVLPGVILDAMYYRLSTDETEKICHINSSVTTGQKAWMLTNQFIVCGVILIIIFNYPYVLYKYCSRRRVHARPTITSIKRNDASTFKAGVANEANTIDGDFETMKQEKQAPSKSHKSIVLFSILTASLLLFWTPNVVYFTIVPFQGYDELAGNIVTMLINVQSVLDPVLFALALKELQDSFGTLFSLITRKLPFLRTFTAYPT